MSRPAPRALLALLLSTLALVAVPAVLPGVTPTSAQAVAEVADFRMVNLINDERARRGLPALQVVDALRTGAALPWSRHLADLRGLAHNPDLRAAVARISPRWTAYTENVGYGANVDQIHGALMNSAGHRANILDSRVRYVAIGTVLRNGTWYVTQDFFATTDALPVQSHNPVGSLDSVTAADDSVSVAGWALDPDTTAPVAVHLYADGRMLSDLGPAGGARGDVAAAYPSYGSARGYRATRALPAGQHQVCAYGLNVGAGGTTLLGCRNVTVTGASPKGALDTVTGGYQRVRTTGWALDPDTTAPIDVHLYADGRGIAVLGPARSSRPDVAAAHPGFGSAHGYDTTVPLAEGTHRVCAYGINTGRGGNSLLGCKDVTVDGPAAHSPFGAVDTARASGGGARVTGWGIDPDTTGSIGVSVLVDGQAVRTLPADVDRPDVGAAYSRGSRHGYDLVLPASRGTHQICVVAKNTGQGADVSLSCRTLTV